MQIAASRRTASASEPSVSTGRKMRSSLKPSPDRNVPTLAIWKKKGRLSVGGERSWSNWAMPSPGPPGATMSAKRWSAAARRA